MGDLGELDSALKKIASDSRFSIQDKSLVFVEVKPGFDKGSIDVKFHPRQSQLVTKTGLDDKFEPTGNVTFESHTGVGPRAAPWRVGAACNIYSSGFSADARLLPQVYENDVDTRTIKVSALRKHLPGMVHHSEGVSFTFGGPSDRGHVKLEVAQREVC